MLFFISCSSEQNEKSDLNSEETVIVKNFIGEADNILNLVQKHMSQIPIEEREVYLTQLFKDNENPLHFFNKLGISENQINSLIARIKELQTKTNFTKLATNEMRMSVIAQSNPTTRKDRNDHCANYFNESNANANNYYFNLGLCCLGATCAGPLAGGICVASATVNFSQTQGGIDRRYPTCSGMY